MKAVIIFVCCFVSVLSQHDYFGCIDRFNITRDTLVCIHFPQDKYISSGVKVLWLANVEHFEWGKAERTFPNLEVRLIKLICVDYLYVIIYFFRNWVAWI